MTDDLRRRVRRRARNRCEYCRLPQSAASTPHQIEHVVAVQHGGGDDASNLALACVRCNLRKGPNIAGQDPATGKLSRLFHPRRNRWSGHFAWQGARLIGLTPIGRTTIHVLAINDPIMIETRETLIVEGRFPLAQRAPFSMTDIQLNQPRPPLDDVYGRIKAVLTEARGRAWRAVNAAMVVAYWEVGRIIVEVEQGGRERADYGKQLRKKPAPLSDHAGLHGRTPAVSRARPNPGAVLPQAVATPPSVGGPLPPPAGPGLCRRVRHATRPANLVPHVDDKAFENCP